jgi:hypothetical protein
MTAKTANPTPPAFVPPREILFRGQEDMIMRASVKIVSAITQRTENDLDFAVSLAFPLTVTLSVFNLLGIGQFGQRVQDVLKF